MFAYPEKYRKQMPAPFPISKAGEAGFFSFTVKDVTLTIIASNSYGWEHVSVSIPDKERCPYWEEMCAVKDLFWGMSDTVLQFHPPKSEYVNNHNYCLHLWRQIGVEVSLPPKHMVGI